MGEPRPRRRVCRRALADGNNVTLVRLQDLLRRFQQELRCHRATGGWIASARVAVNVPRRVERVPVELRPDAVAHRDELAHRHEIDPPRPRVDRDIDAAVRRQASQLVAVAPRVVGVAHPEAGRTLEVQYEAARAGRQHVGGHLRLARRVDALRHRPGVERDAAVLEVARDVAHPASARDRVRRVIVRRHPLDAVVRLEQHTQTFALQRGRDRVERAVGGKLPYPHDVVWRLRVLVLLDLSDQPRIARAEAEADCRPACRHGRRRDEPPSADSAFENGAAAHRRPPCHHPRSTRRVRLADAAECSYRRFGSVAG